MFELTNAQRSCFGLLPVEPGWIRMELKPSPYDRHTTVAYLDGTVIRKYIETGDLLYTEYEICEQLSDDLRYLLPKTQKGKPVLLSAATLKKRNGFGMALSYSRERSDRAHICLFSHTSQRNYYSNYYDPQDPGEESDIRQWAEKWCAETTREDLADIVRFAAQPRQHCRFREGDVFLFQIGRRLYGYGRILLDYAQMRKKKEPFWDILMGKPLACSVYHIVTQRQDVTVAELKDLPSLPSVHIMDNRFYYGEHRIIGNIPIGEQEDYPILYGSSIRIGEKAELLQCGKLYRRKEDSNDLFKGAFSNHAIGFNLKVNLPVLRSCIKAGSNQPYWLQNNWTTNQDLRNPKFRAELEAVCRRFQLSPEQLIKSEHTN